MITINNLTKSYNNNFVLNNVNLQINAGEIFGIIGKSGAGKSTLLRCINLLEQPDSGSVMIAGNNITNCNKQQLRQMRKKIGMIFQGFNLLNSKTVSQNIALPLLFNKVANEQIAKRVATLLNLVKLNKYANYYPNQLSGGQKQRVAIARALATNPTILLSDESTSALDTNNTNSILDLLLEINHKLKVIIILVTHQMEVINKISDKVAVIEQGQIVETNSTVNIVIHPKHEITRQLVLTDNLNDYLAQIENFFNLQDKNLTLLSLLGKQTFDPVLSTLTQNTGVSFNILRAKLGLIKQMPVGQLLLSINGNQEQQLKCYQMLDELKLNYEILQKSS
jgi:D-methionine transport system ATP-binding protein